MNKKVAVIILNWNGKHFLEQFLGNVVANTNPTLADIIVADNGSTDGSIAYLKQEFPNVQIIEFDHNYGFTGGYNKAIGQVSHPYTILLNSDVEVDKGWLEPLLDGMENSPATGACMPKILSQSDKQTFEYAGACGGFIDQYGYPFCRGRILSTIEHDNGQYDNAIDVFWASGACLMVRTELYKKLGGLDADFFAHMEEIDFCWRLQHLGYSIKVYPQSKIFHVGGGTLPNNNPKKMYLNFRNSLYMLTKNLPKNQLYPTLFARMVLDGAAGLSFLAKGQWGFFKAVLKAHWDFYKNFSRFRKKRLEIGASVPKGVYAGSIAWSFVVKGNKTFNCLNHAII